MQWRGSSPVRLPLRGGLSSGSVGYQYGLDRHEFRFSIDARYSTRQYEQIEAIAEFPTKRSSSPVQGFLTAV